MTLPRLWFACGTAGELIKMYPLLALAQERGQPWFMVSTGQSGLNFFRQWDDFGLPRDRVRSVIPTDEDLQRSAQALRWFVRADRLGATELRRRLKEAFGTEPLPSDHWLVHGDTLSSLIGARYASRLGVPLSHVEAGLRSSSLFKPFPEEINRRWVSRYARLHFTQDQRATENLRRAGVRGEVICTGGNTLIDAILRVADSSVDDLPPKPFVIANLHRFENLHSARNWGVLVDVMIRAAAKLPVLLVQHPPTEAKLQAEPETRERLLKAGVQLLPRLPFKRFVKLLHESEYVISDGGSNQEECHYLGKPCLLLRDHTERVEGLEGGSCVLSRFEEAAIDRFLSDPAGYRRPAVRFEKPPSAVILDRLALPASEGLS